MNRLKPHGCFPEVVYRGFNREEYAKEFVEHGHFRLGRVNVYQKYEDEKRRDQFEGTGYVRVHDLVTSIRIPKTGNKPTSETTAPGIVHHRSQLDNHIFVLCCSLSPVRASQFGRHVVRICNPERLAVDMNKYLESLPWKVFGGVEGVIVQYTTGDVVASEPSAYEMAQFSYTQKPRCFNRDREFRFVTIQGRKSNPNGDYFEVDLQTHLGYVNHVKSCWREELWLLLRRSVLILLGY